MRPSVEVATEQRYECVECGTRVVEAETRRCECGGQLRNLTRCRDL